jgi:hypothetical protein
VTSVALDWTGLHDPVFRGISGSSYYNSLELEIILIPAPGSWKKAVFKTQDPGFEVYYMAVGLALQLMTMFDDPVPNMLFKKNS